MRYFVAITGGSGSGKSEFAKNLRNFEELKPYITSISMDNYYKDLSHLTNAERAVVNFDVPNQLDLDRFKRDLENIKYTADAKAEIPTYSFDSHTRGRNIVIDLKCIVLVEGLFVLYNPDIMKLFDLTIFIDCISSERLCRRLDRDVKERGRDLHSVTDQWRKTVEPGFQNYIRHIKHRVDFVINSRYTSDEDSMFLSTPLSIIKSHLLDIIKQ